MTNVWYSVNGERLGTYNGHTGAVWCVDCDCILWTKEYTCLHSLSTICQLFSHVIHCLQQSYLLSLTHTLQGTRKMYWQVQPTTAVDCGIVRLVGKNKLLQNCVLHCKFSSLSCSLSSVFIYHLSYVIPSSCAVQVNSWRCSTPTLLSERAVSISAATSSCSPQTSRWVTSAIWTSSTWEIHSRLVHFDFMLLLLLL